VTWVIAHRGASRDCPQNTFAAFDAALDHGCDGIELDVQLSLDGVPVVYHDRTLARAGGGRRRVHRTTLDELLRLDPGARHAPRFAGQRIPTLDEVLRRYAGRTRLLVEIKAREGHAGRSRHHELARKTALAVDERIPRGEGYLLSFDAGVLDACAEVAPDVPRVLNLRPGPVLDTAQRKRLGSLAGLSADVRGLTANFGAAVLHARRLLFAFTCNTPRTVRRAVEAGASGVMSDRPDWLGAWLRAEGGGP
jgi:glycerophosphoryl diester phosphodiesterase